VQNKREELETATELSWNNRRLHGSDASALARLLQATKLKECLTIFLNGNDLRCHGITALAPCFHMDRVPQLRELYLHNSRIADEGVKALTTAGLPRLRSLMLHTNRIGDEGFEAMAAAILSRDLYAKNLEVFSNAFSREGHQALGIACIKRFIDVQFGEGWPRVELPPGFKLHESDEEPEEEEGEESSDDDEYEEGPGGFKTRKTPKPPAKTGWWGPSLDGNTPGSKSLADAMKPKGT